jgi:hypothetical protein
MNPEFTKQFQATLFSDKILITTPDFNKSAYEAKLNSKRKITIGDHDWIETKDDALNYYECCGILILFGIAPPDYKTLCREIFEQQIKYEADY